MTPDSRELGVCTGERGGTAPGEVNTPLTYRGAVLRYALWVLRQRRYAALALFMLVVAGLCALAGTWQISRYQQTVHDNNAMRANFHAAAVPLSTSLVPLVGQAPAPGRDAIRYRPVTTSGRYVAGSEQYLANQSQHGVVGFYVLDRFRTAAATLLVVRGFVRQAADGTPPRVSPPPTGPVSISGRLNTAETGPDGAGRLGQHVVISINPGEQMARIASPVYDGYLNLVAGQPGTAGVKVLPNPSLANPAGGAAEWQHMAYIVQWYLFALLGLAAPFVMARHEIRDARHLYLGYDPDEVEFGIEPVEAGGRLELPSGAEPDGTSPEGALAVRSQSALVGHRQPTRQEWEQAARLADRYGRSIGTRRSDKATPPPEPRRPRVPQRVGHDYVAPNSRVRPHRAVDSYHGAYNDYLWELGLADGDTPDVVLPAPPPEE